jgi:hypothetical protein
MYSEVNITEYETSISGGGYLRLTHYKGDDSVNLVVTNPDYEPVAAFELTVTSELSEVAEIISKIITAENKIKTAAKPAEKEGTN